MTSRVSIDLGLMQQLKVAMDDLGVTLDTTGTGSSKYMSNTARQLVYGTKS
jgi:hypothetical protein